MPVIRGLRQHAALPPERREALARLVRQEIAGGGGPGGPLIFEIPLDRSPKFDVLVVWDEWAGVRSEDRSDIILDAYADRNESISLALGVTAQEADDQRLLPYSIAPVVSPKDVDMAAVRAAMKEQGGVEGRGGKVELRLPTLAMARQVRAALKQAMPLPNGFWVVTQPTGTDEE